MVKVKHRKDQRNFFGFLICFILVMIRQYNLKNAMNSSSEIQKGKFASFLTKVKIVIFEEIDDAKF